VAERGEVRGALAEAKVAKSPSETRTLSDGREAVGVTPAMAKHQEAALKTRWRIAGAMR